MNNPKDQNLPKKISTSIDIAGEYYNKGQYEKALEHFNYLYKNKPELRENISCYQRFCKTVLSKELSDKDWSNEIDNVILDRDIKTHEHLRLLWIPIIILLTPIVLILEADFLKLNFYTVINTSTGFFLIYILFKVKADLYSELRSKKIRCKYCGHYTEHIHPNSGLAYLGSNNCSVCNRGYPAPSIAWDSIEGQNYIYNRGSVTDREFYEEFEKNNPEHPKSKQADHYLGRI